MKTLLTIGAMLLCTQMLAQETRVDYKVRKVYAHNPDDTSQRILILQEKVNDCGYLQEEIAFVFDDLQPFDTNLARPHTVAQHTVRSYIYQDDCLPTKIVVASEKGRRSRSIEYEYLHDKIFETREMDGQGRLIRRTEYSYEGPSGKISSALSFNSNNQNIETIIYNYSGSQLTGEKQINHTFKDTVVLEYQYDRNNQLIQRNINLGQSSGGKVYAYEDGRLVSERITDESGRTIEFRTRYDASGRAAVWQEWDITDGRLLKHYQYTYE